MLLLTVIHMACVPPLRPGWHARHQAWLQEWCWTEASRASKLEERHRHLQHGAETAHSAALDREPMFCMETAVKLLYFSGLSYRVNEQVGPE
jgi:hypothetical protein